MMNDIQILEQNNLPGSLKQIKISAGKETLKKNKDEAFKKIQEEVAIDGFRKGKAPSNLIESKYANQILEQSLDSTLRNVSNDVLQNLNIFPLNTPSVTIQNFKPEESIEFTLEFYIYPEVKLRNVNSIKVEESKLSEEEEKLPDKEKSELVRKNQDTYFHKLITEALNLMEVDIPNVMIEEEVMQRESNFIKRLKELNISLEDYLKAKGTTKEEQSKEWENDATYSVKQQLFLTQYAKDKNIEVKNEEVENEIARLDPQLQNIYNTGSNRLYVAQLILHQKAFNKLVEEVGGKNESNSNSN